MSRKSTPALDAVLAALKASPSTLTDLRPLCNSRHAVAQIIYRLRNLGHEIVLIPGGTRKAEGKYYLRRLAGDLRDWTYE